MHHIPPHKKPSVNTTRYAHTFPQASARYDFISASLRNSVCLKYFEEVSYSAMDRRSEQDFLCIPCSDGKKKTQTTQQTTEMMDFH